MFLVLDGAAGTYLQKLGVELHPQLWSSIVLLPENTPQAQKLYATYLDAGADVITSCTYQASIPGFVKLGKSSEEAFSIIKAGVETAKNEAHSRGKFVAAGLGPYGAYLCSGQEYTGDYGSATKQTLAEFWEPRIKAVLEACPDYLLFETIPSVLEIEVLNELKSKLCADLPAPPPSWLSLSIKVEGQSVKLADGTALEDLKSAVSSFDLVGANCFGINSILTACEKFQTFGKPLIFYPNDGAVYDGVSKEWKSVDSNLCFDKSLINTLANANVQVLGGCCNTSPETIHIIKSCV